MNEAKHGVYVRTDAQGRVTAINSDAFLTDTASWTRIDEGCYASGINFSTEL